MPSPRRPPSTRAAFARSVNPLRQPLATNPVRARRTEPDARAIVRTPLALRASSSSANTTATTIAAVGNVRSVGAVHEWLDRTGGARGWRNSTATRAVVRPTRAGHPVHCSVFRHVGANRHGGQVVRVGSRRPFIIWSPSGTVTNSTLATRFGPRTRGQQSPADGHVLSTVAGDARENESTVDVFTERRRGWDPLVGASRRGRYRRRFDVCRLQDRAVRSRRIRRAGSHGTCDAVGTRDDHHAFIARGAGLQSAGHRTFSELRARDADTVQVRQERSRLSRSAWRPAASAARARWRSRASYPPRDGPSQPRCGRSCDSSVVSLDGRTPTEVPRRLSD
jgi:hypothetical protein